MGWLELGDVRETPGRAPSLTSFCVGPESPDRKTEPGRRRESSLTHVSGENQSHLGRHCIPLPRLSVSTPLRKPTRTGEHRHSTLTTHRPPDGHETTEFKTPEVLWIDRTGLDFGSRTHGRHTHRDTSPLSRYRPGPLRTFSPTDNDLGLLSPPETSLLLALSAKSWTVQRGVLPKTGSQGAMSS